MNVLNVGVKKKQNALQTNIFGTGPERFNSSRVRQNE
jgi:hypothetical protein